MYTAYMSKCFHLAVDVVTREKMSMDINFYADIDALKGHNKTF